MYKYLDIVIEPAMHDSGECGYDGHYVLYPDGAPDKMRIFIAPGIFMDHETAHAAIVEHAKPLITAGIKFKESHQ
jgi:hypothetical protein